MICIVDYGVGNLGSISNMLRRVGVESIVSHELDAIRTADKIILPGVGSFDTCATKLKESGLMETLERRVRVDRVPLLGVCVGMQLLFEGSDEGTSPGLGWVKGRVVKFNAEMLPAGTKIPHMGWADIAPAKPSRLLQGLDNARFYFVHSFHAQVVDTSDVLVTAAYGYTFVAGVERGNIMGVQFHPEKSHRFGMKLLENFAKDTE